MVITFISGSNSWIDDFTVYTSSPNGGVSNPASMAIMPMMAKAMGSYPSLTAMGAKMAAVSSMMEIESIIMPSANQINTMTEIIIQGAMPDSKKTPSMALAKPVMASVLEYSDAVTSSNRIGAEVRPTDRME